MWLAKGSRPIRRHGNAQPQPGQRRPGADRFRITLRVPAGECLSDRLSNLWVHFYARHYFDVNNRNNEGAVLFL